MRGDKIDDDRLAEDDTDERAAFAVESAERMESSTARA